MSYFKLKLSNLESTIFHFLPAEVTKIIADERQQDS